MTNLPLIELDVSNKDTQDLELQVGCGMMEGLVLSKTSPFSKVTLGMVIPREFL